MLGGSKTSKLNLQFEKQVLQLLNIHLGLFICNVNSKLALTSHKLLLLYIPKINWKQLLNKSPCSQFNLHSLFIYWNPSVSWWGWVVFFLLKDHVFWISVSFIVSERLPRPLGLQAALSTETEQSFYAKGLSLRFWI